MMEARKLFTQLEAALSGGENASEIDRTLNSVEKIAVLTSAIAAVEHLAGRRYLDESGPYPWRINRTRLEHGESPLRTIAPLMEYPRVLAIPTTRLLAAMRLLLGNPGHKERTLLLATVLGTSAAMQIHHHQGSDGADQTSFIALLTALLAKAFPHDERAKRACLQMIAFQSCLSYSASGAIKLSSPTWRSGRAITGIFRTMTFGDEDFYRFAKLHPAIPKVIAWSAILGETLFPLVLVTPKPVSRGILAGMGLFHLANSRFMGLNRFPFAFASTYPAVAYVAKKEA
jgi:hypothetical protein